MSKRCTAYNWKTEQRDCHNYCLPEMNVCWEHVEQHTLIQTLINRIAELEKKAEKK